MSPAPADGRTPACAEAGAVSVGPGARAWPAVPLTPVQRPDRGGGWCVRGGRAGGLHMGLSAGRVWGGGVWATTLCVVCRGPWPHSVLHTALPSQRWEVRPASHPPRPHPSGPSRDMVTPGSRRWAPDGCCKAAALENMLLSAGRASHAPRVTAVHTHPALTPREWQPSTQRPRVPPRRSQGSPWATCPVRRKTYHLPVKSFEITSRFPPRKGFIRKET